MTGRIAQEGEQPITVRPLRGLTLQAIGHAPAPEPPLGQERLAFLSRFIGTHGYYDEIDARTIWGIGEIGITPIKTKRDYRRTLKEIEGLMDAKRDTPKGDRLDVLVTLVEAREAKR